MPKKKYHFNLDAAERQQLEALLCGGQHASRKLTRARILLKAAAGCLDEESVEAVEVGRATVERVRQRFVERGLDCLPDAPRPGAVAKLDEKAEARLIAEACSQAPAGCQRWTLKLLAERVVALELADAYSHESVRSVLKKTHGSPG